MISAAVSFRLLPRDGGLALAQGTQAGLAVDALMTGRRVDEVRQMLPALFGLCRSVQEWAMALALGLPLPPLDDLRRDMIRDHLARLCLHLPPQLGLAPLALPQGWQAGGRALRVALFGQDGLPGPGDLAAWSAGPAPFARLVAAVQGHFAPGEAVSDLPAMTDPFGDGPVENSLATRHAGHPLLMAVRGAYGHGPLVHLLARLVDLDALSRGAFPPPRRMAQGAALVPCSRGLCALELRAAGGIVTRFSRRTPTDHLLMPGGLLAASLATLPPHKADRAPLLAMILDPCIPLHLEAGPHA
ncbi:MULTISPECIES: hydrogenase expression/formation protein HupK [Paracoccus]|uniref:hydrogenase expression/formation protein HupK n=1 Tax=Paracoccus TaxID=265 RepID=UPI002585C3A8|nr:hydrogenase expression/formation protein HupK [Paracoccus sp. (in: a-proteobacteria)]